MAFLFIVLPFGNMVWEAFGFLGFLLFLLVIIAIRYVIFAV